MHSSIWQPQPENFLASYHHSYMYASGLCASGCQVSCRYNLTQWAIQLNEITPGLKEKLAPTDCRLRPDQHHLELGEYDQVRHSCHIQGP